MLASRWLQRSSMLLCAPLMMAASAPAWSQTTYNASNQVEFDDAVALATAPGRNDTIDVTAVNIASPALMLPAAASSIVINFNGSSSGPAVYNPTLDVGFGALNQTLGIGAGTTLNFNTNNGIASLRVGFANGATDGSGTVNMTGGTINGVFTGTNNYFTLNVGRGSADSEGTFNQSGGSIFINGGAFNLGVAEATGTYTMSGDAKLDMGPGTVCIGCVDGNGTLTVGGNAQFLVNDVDPPEGHGQVYIGSDGGSGLVIQNGAGSRVVLSAQNGTHLGLGGGTGEYQLSAGQLIFGGLGSGTAGLNLGDSVGGTGTFTQTGGLLTLNTGQIRFGLGGAGTGTYNLNGGTLQVNVANPFAVAAASYAFNLGGGTIQALTDFNTAINFTLTGGTSTFDTTAAGTDVTLSGILSGAGALQKAGAGALTLSGNNSYSGGTVLDGGTVIVGSSTAFGTGDVAFAGSSTLQFAGNYTLANDMTIDPSVVATMNTIGNTDTIGGAIDGAGALLKTGAGVLVLNADNTYTGGTQIAAGTLRLGTGASLAASGALQIDTPGTFDIGSQAQTIGSLSGDGAVIGSAMLTAGGNNASTAFSGSVAGAFAKVGTGTMTIDDAAFGSALYVAGGKIAQTSGNTSVAYLAVGEQPGGNGGLDVSGGVLTIGDALQIGDFGAVGTVNQTGGTVNVGSSMNIGNQGGNGTYNISSGQLNLEALLNTVGRSTGANPTSTGALNISGDGVVDVDNNGVDPSRLIIGYQNAQGTINQTGGTLRVHDGSTLHLSGDSAHTGIYNLYGGALEIGGTNGLQAGYNNPNPNYEFNLGGGTIKVIEAALTTNVDATLLADTASTIDTNGLGATWGGVLSGDGALVKAGDGALIFNAANTYTGGTEIAAGTLQLGTGGSLGPTGALMIDSLGTFDLNGHTQTVGAFSGAGNVLLGSGALTTDSALNTQFSGSMSGTGSFEKQGSGTLYLTGNSDYTGATILDGGKLVVNGSLASQVTVESGTLGGNGSVGGLIVSGDGIAAPGNSIGTIHVAGIVIFQPQSLYQVEVGSAGQTDLIDATGTATINGGTVAITQLAPVTVGTRYTILSADGGRNGTFDGVTGNFAFLTPTLGYDTNDVYLDFVRNGVSFADVALTPNQRSVAGALDQFPANSPLTAAILSGSAAGAQQAFNALSGEVHADAASALVLDSFYVRDAIFGRLRQASYGDGSGPQVAFGASGPTTVAMIDPGSRMSLGAGLDDIGAGGGPSSGHGLAFWTRGFGAWGNLDGNGNAATTDRSLGGFVSGVDAGLGSGWRAGLATGYIQSNIGVNARASSADIDSYVLAGYAGGNAGPFAVRSGGAWTWHGLDTTRNVAFPSFFETERASYNADTGQLFAEVAYPVLYGASAWEPFAGLSYVHVGTDGFTEDGILAALSSGGADQNVGVSLLGLRAATTLPVHGVMVTPHGSVAWQYAFGDVTPEQAFAFASNGIAFGIGGVPIAQSSALIEAGLDFAVGTDAVLGVSYTGQLASDMQDNSVQGRFNWRF